MLPIAALSAVVLLVLVVARASAAQGDVTGDFVLGQPNFISSPCGLSATSLCSPHGVAVDSAGNVYVADNAKNRVLQYDNPLNTDAIADRVFGQGGSFTSGACNLGGITASSLCQPTDVAVDNAGNLYVVDWQNNRVLEYYTPLSSDLIADRVFGQGNSFTSGAYTGFWYEVNPTANTLTNPYSVAVDSALRVYVGDRGMHRVLEYDLGDTTADRVFGQLGSMTTGLPNKGGISANSLEDVNGIGIDPSGNLYVTDGSNARALMYKTPITTDTTADAVFGQYGSFTTNNPNDPGVNADTLESPTDIIADIVGNVYITDTGTERTLEYDEPLVFGTTADVVFAQGGSFTTWGNNNGGISATSQGDPWSIAVGPGCNIWISEYGNNRVVEFDKPPNACVESTNPTPTPVPPTPPVLNTAPGTSVVVSLNGGTAFTKGVVVTFDTVTGAGNTTVSMGKTGPPPPAGLEVTGVGSHNDPGNVQPVDPVFYEINTTATTSGSHKVCITYDTSQINSVNTPLLMHYAVGGWSNITDPVPAVGDVICGHTTSLSPFAVMQAVVPVGGTTELLTGPSTGSNGTGLPLIAVVVGLAVASFAGGAVQARRRR